MPASIRKWKFLLISWALQIQFGNKQTIVKWSYTLNPVFLFKKYLSKYLRKTIRNKSLYAQIFIG